MRTFACALFLVAVLFPLVAICQEPDNPAPPAGKQPLSSSPEALAILADAIRHQGPEALAQPNAIRDLTVRIQSTVWDYGRTPPQRLQIGVRRFMTVEPERFRSEWTTLNETQVQGFDGRRYWYSDKDGAQWLMGEAKKDSREEVRKEIDETKYLLRFFFLANLKGPRVVFQQIAGQRIQVRGEGRTCKVLKRDNIDPESTEPPLTLWIDDRTNTLLKATAHATTYGQKSLSFIFQYNERVQPRVKGVLFPYQIEVREQPFGAERDRISLIANLEEQGGIEFNTDLKKDIFLRPK